jgi:acyl-CoA synthetase (AMP-forming)/AMP-acid ligase II
MNATEWILQIAREHAARPFLVDPRDGSRLTFGDLDRDARRIAAELRGARGLARGDGVAFMAHNSIALATAYFGCLYAGVVAIPVNPVLAAPEIAYILRESGARLLVLGDGVAAPGGDDGARLPDAIPLAALDPAALPATDMAPFDGVAPGDPLCVVYTSGTTGRPSPVAHTIADLVDNARMFNAALGIGPRHRFYGVLAMTYLGGYYNLLLLPYVAGASVAVTDAFDARAALDFWSRAAAAEVTALWLVPTIAAILLQLDRGEDGPAYCRAHVDLALIGTAPLPASLRARVEERYGLTLHENFALSETLFLTSSTPADPAPHGSVGRPLPGIGVRVAGGADEGILDVRTPYLTPGAPVDADGWFATGDVGRLDGDGRLQITGRAKDIIIRGGVNVSPAAAEDVLLSHPAVVEAAVVGVPHPQLGEDAVAAVRLSAGADPDAVRGELLALCRERLGATNRPARIVALDALPHSSSGKIQKARVRELVVAA